MRSAKHFLLILVFSSIVVSGAAIRADDKIDKKILLFISSGNCNRCSLRGANLMYVQRKRASLKYADLSDANLSYSDLEEADLTSANLTNSNLHGSSLRKANLTGARIDGANLVNTDLTGAIITTQQLIKTNWTEAYGYDLNQFSSEDLQSGIDSLIFHRQYSRAETFFKILTLKMPSNPEILVGRSINLLQLGQDGQSIAYLNAARILYKEQGDKASIDIIDKFISRHAEASANAKPRAEGSGAGIKAINNLQQLIPILLPLAMKAFLAF